jgi:hypothetical protein
LTDLKTRLFDRFVSTVGGFSIDVNFTGVAGSSDARN